MEPIQLAERKFVNVNQAVTVPEGETQVVIALPEAVPQGKVLSLRIEINGEYRDASGN